MSSRYAVKEKQFQSRESIYMELFNENVFGKTMYNLFAAHGFVMLFTSLLKDYATQREIGTLQFIYWKFEKLDRCFYLWLGFNIITFLSYFCFKFWATYRHKLKPTLRKIWDISWIFILCWYNIMCLYHTCRIVAVAGMGTATNGIISVEALRFLMKIHAFVRSNVPKVLRVKSTDERNMNIPKFSKFLFFLYVPTLVYRDEYPRTNKIRWSFVMYRMLEFVCLTFFLTCGLIDGLLILAQDFCLRKHQYSEIILICVQGAIYSLWLTWGTAFIVLHLVQNIVGELLCFGDRLFCSDWWTSHHFGQYFKRWNHVIADWLQCYVYKDFHESITPGNKNLAKLASFALSSLGHEWIAVSIVGFFLPICSVMFLSGALLLMSVQFQNKGSDFYNILYFFCQIIGAGQLFLFILLEYYARVNLKITESAGLIPVMFTNCTTW
ncbi:hypothetical protein JTB14_006068 [Gonioctena quinquepunctata]|nr:hypothetical protein JTB14_006068 [Gonioctena quinquepunctata]